MSFSESSLSVTSTGSSHDKRRTSRQPSPSSIRPELQAFPMGTQALESIGAIERLQRSRSRAEMFVHLDPPNVSFYLTIPIKLRE
jgi:hypothetical protein